MPRKWICAGLLATAVFTSGYVCHPVAPRDVRIFASRTAALDLAASLKAELITAVRRWGPVEALTVCRERAPAIAGRISLERGWEVGRTSLRVRNPANAPDPWEQEVLRQFEERLARGEKVEDLEFARICSDGERAEFRYMKALPTGEICLLCHGSELAPEVARRLDSLYPADQARGFALGDIRGAITIVQPLAGEPKEKR